MFNKCKCLPYINFRSTGEYSMGFRQTLTVFSLKGLHRDWYNVTDLDLWFLSNFEKGAVLIKHRVSANAKYKFIKKS